MKRMLLALIIALAAVPDAAFAGPITYNLRDPFVESIDEVNSFDLTVNGLTATLTALPDTYNGNSALLNQTLSSFGINVENTTCGGLENSAQLDGGCTGESIAIRFGSAVSLNSLKGVKFRPR